MNVLLELEIDRLKLNPNAMVGVDAIGGATDEDARVGLLPQTAPVADATARLCYFC
jgi:hypothetical protein